MKTFEQLFAELQYKNAVSDPESGTVKELRKGVHFIGKKVVEEAAEVWDELVYLVYLVFPPVDDICIEWIGSFQPSNLNRGGEIDGEIDADAIGA